MSERAMEKANPLRESAIVQLEQADSSRLKNGMGPS